MLIIPDVIQAKANVIKRIKEVMSLSYFIIEDATFLNDTKLSKLAERYSKELGKELYRITDGKQGIK